MTTLATVRTALARFAREEEGATLVEYALLIGLIAVVCIAAIRLIGTSTNTQLNSAATALNPPAGP